MCPVQKYCNLKFCLDPSNHWISEFNCTCKGCIERFISENPDKQVPNCEFSGDGYNSDGDCIMEK